LDNGKKDYIIEEIVARLPEVVAAGGRRYGDSTGLVFIDCKFNLFSFSPETMRLKILKLWTN